MPVCRSRGCEGIFELASENAQTQEPIRAAEFIYQEPFAAERPATNQLDRLVVAADSVLDIGGRIEDGCQAAVHIIEVIVVARRIKRVRPMEEWRTSPPELHQNGVSSIAKVV